MMLIATYGTVERMGQEKKRVWKINGEQFQSTFKYPELFHNHFQYRHAVDDHNNRRQSPISVERTWSTKWWPHRIFAFLLAITEINVFKAWIECFGHEDAGTLSLRKTLAEELINNPYLMEENAHQARTECPAACGIGHNLMALCPFCKFQG